MRRKDEGVTVGLRAHQLGDRDRAGGAGLDLHHETAGKLWLHLVGDKARHHVHQSAGGVAGEHGDRALRVLRCRGHSEREKPRQNDALHGRPPRRRCYQAAFFSARCSAGFSRSYEVHRGVDQRDVGEGLGEVAEHAPPCRVVLLGEQADVVGERRPGGRRARAPRPSAPAGTGCRRARSCRRGTRPRPAAGRRCLHACDSAAPIRPRSGRGGSLPPWIARAGPRLAKSP